MIPLYAFVEGDMLGLLILADEGETVGSVATKAQSAASVRVVPTREAFVFYRGARVDPRVTVALAGFEPLSRIDIRSTAEAIAPGRGNAAP